MSTGDHMMTLCNRYGRYDEPEHLAEATACLYGYKVTPALVALAALILAQYDAAA